MKKSNRKKLASIEALELAVDRSQLELNQFQLTLEKHQFEAQKNIYLRRSQREYLT